MAMREKVSVGQVLDELKMMLVQYNRDKHK